MTKLRQTTKARIPKFMYDYAVGGTGYETCLRANRQSLDAVKLKPKRFSSVDAPDCSCDLFGRTYDAPFGVAPIGFGDVIWPRMAEILAKTASRHNVPLITSTYTFSSPEKIFELAGGNAWLQLYVPKCPDIEQAVINRAKSIGYGLLVVTLDCPKADHRTSETRPLFSKAPKVNLKTAFQVAARPAWALNLMRFRNEGWGILEPFVPAGLGLHDSVKLLTGIATEHLSLERLAKIRDRWSGKLIVKGVLAGEDASKCAAMGGDGIVVSNHGGRQLDAAPSALDVIEEVQSAAGANVIILADGSILSGLDIARMLASGANFVLAGRAFIYGVASLGEAGADYVFSSFKRDLAATMTQIGCANVAQLPSFLLPQQAANRAGKSHSTYPVKRQHFSDARPIPRQKESFGRVSVAQAREQDL